LRHLAGAEQDRLEGACQWGEQRWILLRLGGAAVGRGIVLEMSLGIGGRMDCLKGLLKKAKDDVNFKSGSHHIWPWG